MINYFNDWISLTLFQLFENQLFDTLSFDYLNVIKRLKLKLID